MGEGDGEGRGESEGASNVAGGGAGPGAGDVPSSPPWSLRHDAGVSASIVVTFRIYLSGTVTGAGGGALLFPSVGLNDRRMYNATMAVLEDPAHRWNLQATEGEEGGAYERAMRSKNMKRAAADPVGLCG